MIKIKLLFIALLFVFQSGFSQTEKLIKGKVLSEQFPVEKVEVANFSSKKVSITNLAGEFSLVAQAGDELIFISKNHDIKKIIIDQKTINKNNLLISLTLKPEQLKEVVVQNTPSIKLSKDAKWEQAKLDQYTLEKNASKLKNPGVYDGTIENGMDIMRIGGMIAKLFKKKNTDLETKGPVLPFAEASKTKIETEFYTDTLQLRQEEIASFLDFCNKDPKSKIIAAQQNILSLQEFLSSKILHFKSL